jgi:hypothetical protein
VTEYVVGEFNCSCVGISMFQAVCGGEKTLADVPDADYFEACKLTDLMGKKALQMLEAKNKRYNALMPSPAGARYKPAVVQFSVPGTKNGDSAKLTKTHIFEETAVLALRRMSRSFADGLLDSGIAHLYLRMKRGPIAGANGVAIGDVAHWLSHRAIGCDFRMLSTMLLCDSAPGTTLDSVRVPFAHFARAIAMADDRVFGADLAPFAMPSSPPQPASDVVLSNRSSSSHIDLSQPYPVDDFSPPSSQTTPSTLGELWASLRDEVLEEGESHAPAAAWCAHMLEETLNGTNDVSHSKPKPPARDAPLRSAQVFPSYLSSAPTPRRIEG